MFERNPLMWKLATVASQTGIDLADLRAPIG